MVRERKEVKEIFIRVNNRKLEIIKDGYSIKFIHDIYKFLKDKKLIGKPRKEVVYEVYKFLTPLIRYCSSHGQKDIPLRVELDEKTFDIYAIKEVIVK